MEKDTPGWVGEQELAELRSSALPLQAEGCGLFLLKIWKTPGAEILGLASFVLGGI